MEIKPLSAEQRRQLIDTQQVYEAWRDANSLKRHSFAGSMRWGARGEREYLIRKIGRIETSLGPRSEATEAICAAFKQGRSENADRLNGLADRLDNLARVNVALGLGRVPHLVGRILRICDDLLGEQLTVVGTNALFAHESQAGVHIESKLTASGDIDFLYDARRHLTFAVKSMATEGLIGLLRRVDRSFKLTRDRYRAVNRDGYFVDLIRPEAKEVFRDRLPSSISDANDDLEGVAVFGLEWLVNSPKVEAIAIDDRGYPLRLVVVDPRIFALHKAWLSKQAYREPVKATRDWEQARVAATIATQYLRKSLDAPELSALPRKLLAALD